MSALKRALRGAVRGLKNFWSVVTDRSGIVAIPEPAVVERSTDGVVTDNRQINEVPLVSGRNESGASRISDASSSLSFAVRKAVKKAEGAQSRKAGEPKSRRAGEPKSGKARAKKAGARTPAKKPAAKKAGKPKSRKAGKPKSRRAGEPESGKARAKKPLAKTAARRVEKTKLRIRKKPAVAGARRRAAAARFERHEANPVLEPSSRHAWESKAVFNPAAAHAGGKIHVLYRAIGDDDVSVLGYASSEDGVTFDERLDEPVYVSCHEPAVRDAPRAPQVAYGSGGGWNGGCEDPRLTFIENDAYLLFTAFDGWGSVRIGMTSISKSDFLNKRWRWRPRTLLSPPGEIHKNWVLFPEKIGGKFAILHSISPRIQIAYVDSLKELAGKEAHINSRYERAPRGRSWDSWVRGAGPPPIRTKKGWLLLYHAMDDRDPGRYKVGAMLLDLKDPTKVIARTPAPLLEPDVQYENKGFKSGVVYCCGAVIKGGRLIVYYGGADTVVCAAEIALADLLGSLVKERAAKLKTRRTSVKRKRHDAR